MSANGSNKEVKWYYRPVTVIVAILAFGPLALPIVWMSPALKKWHKVVLTVLIMALTVWMVRATADIYSNISKQMRDMQALF